MSSDKIESMMGESKVFQPPKNDKARVKSLDEYRAIYKRSMEDMDGYWAERAEELLTWQEKMGQGPGIRFRQTRDQVVPERQAQRHLQLSGPPPGERPPQQGRYHLAG